MQSKEQEINFIADHVQRDICKCETVEEMQEIYLEFLKLVNKQQADYVETELIMMRRDEKQEFFADIIENGIYVHEPPFVGNTSFDQFVGIYEKHPEWLKPYKCEGIEKPLVIGDEYFIRLKHESSNKLSIRAKGMLNIKNLPSKSALKKEKKSMYNDNPIRFGEMEVAYMYLSQRPELVAKMLRAYSTNMEDRQNLVELLITAKDPLNVTLPEQSGKSITRQMLDNYLAVLEIELED